MKKDKVAVIDNVSRVNVSCEDHKDGKDGKCYCSFLNRKWGRDLKMYRTMMKGMK